MLLKEGNDVDGEVSKAPYGTSTGCQTARVSFSPDLSIRSAEKWEVPSWEGENGPRQG